MALSSVKMLSAALVATQERPNDLALAREYLALVREHNVRVSADVCRVGALAVVRHKELAADERTCADTPALSCVCGGHIDEGGCD